jgi:hypothetical protein
MVIIVECGLCGAKMEIPRDNDGRFLVWPCHCQGERDLSAIEKTTSILSNILGALHPPAGIPIVDLRTRGFRIRG